MAENQLTKEEKAEIKAAIEKAELNTSGEIRVHLENHCKAENVLDRAAQMFAELKMHKTAQRNGVLIYMAIKDHKFAIIGDAGINANVEEGFWDITKEKMVKAVELGADQVINYHEDPQWYKTIFAMTNKKGVDCVVDNVGAATINNSMRCVKNGGRIVIVGNTSGPNVEIDLRILFAKQISLLGSTMGNHDDYHQAMQLLFNGKIQPVIDDVLPLSNGIAAFRKMAEGKQFGKLLIQST